MPVLARQFKNVFPELSQQEEFVAKVIREEEDAFLRTLGKGIDRFQQYETSNILQPVSIDNRIGGDTDKPIVINGKFAFELYDTYGFPLDLTKLIASEKGWRVDENGFETEMQQQKDRSRAATKIDTEDWIEVNESDKTNFIGYNDLETDTTVVKYRKVKAKNKEQFQIVLATTPFYAESGGQVGDKGFLQFGNEKIIVTDTKKENELIIHFTDKLPDDLSFPVKALLTGKKD